MKRGNKKRKRVNEDDPNNGPEEGSDCGTTSADDPSTLSPELSMLQPELQLLIQKFSLQKHLSMLEMKKLLALIITEFNQYVPMLKQNSKKVDQLEEANKVLTQEKNEAVRENSTLKEQISRNQAPKILIKNMPLHPDSKDFCESQDLSKLQFRKLLASIDLPDLKFKSVHRWRPFSTRLPVMEIEMENMEARKILKNKLYLLKKNRSEFASIIVQDLFPKHLNTKLKEKESISYFIRKEMNTKTKILMKNNNLIIHFLSHGTWIIWDEEQPINNQPAIFSNSTFPKKVKTIF